MLADVTDLNVIVRKTIFKVRFHHCLLCIKRPVNHYLSNMVSIKFNFNYSLLIK